MQRISLSIVLEPDFLTYAHFFVVSTFETTTHLSFQQYELDCSLEFMDLARSRLNLTPQITEKMYIACTVAHIMQKMW